MSGYTVRQLLALASGDRLIEGYSIEDDGRIVLDLNGTRHILSEPDAEQILRDLIRRVNRGRSEA